MRYDIVELYESDSFTVYSENLDGKPREGILNNLQAMVQEAIILPVPLVGDESHHIRLVIDEPLTNSEKAEWLARIDWQLNVADGRLIVESGFDIADPGEETFCIIDIPSGQYRAQIYTYFPGYNAAHCYENMQGDEPAGAWFRRTRPDTSFPDWLKYYLLDFPEYDPGHESKWDAFIKTDEYNDFMDAIEDSGYIGFLVHLTPLLTPDTLPQVDDNLLDSQGWFLTNLNARKPRLCPMGLPVNPAQIIKPNYVPQQGATILEDNNNRLDVALKAQLTEKITRFDSQVSPSFKTHDMQRLLDDLGSDDIFQRIESIDTLIERGADVLDDLLRAFDTFDTLNQKAQAGMIYVSGQIGGEKAFQALTKKFTGVDAILRAEIIPALAQFEDIRTFDYFIEALEDDSSLVQLRAFVALQNMGDSRAIPVMIEHIQSDDLHTKRNACETLAILDPIQAIPYLITAMDTDDDFTRFDIGVHLINKIGEPAIDPIITTLKNPASIAQTHGLLSALHPMKDPRTIPILATLLRDTTRFRNKRTSDLAAEVLKNLDTVEAKSILKQWKT